MSIFATKENVVMRQIWTANIVILWLQYLKNETKYDRLIFNLITFI